MPSECLSDVALGQRYCLHGSAFRAAFLHSLQGFKGKRLRPGKRQAWTPITGCKGFKRFKGFKGFTGLRAGGCGLGAAVACAVRRSEQLLHSLQGCKNFKGKCLRPGKRQAWTP